MRLILPLLALLSIAGCATKPAEIAKPMDPNCMSRENIAQVLAGQGLTATILDDDQNAAWRAYDNTHSQSPDPVGFTYVIGQGDTPATVVIGFDPVGCAAYHVTVSSALVAEIIGSGA
jgi:hypothetical protein